MQYILIVDAGVYKVVDTQTGGVSAVVAQGSSQTVMQAIVNALNGA